MNHTLKKQKDAGGFTRHSESMFPPANKRGITTLFFRRWGISAQSAGFTLLYASLISALILAIGIAIASFALRATVFSSSARQSVYAIYAADTGVECAAYLDFVENAFGPGSSVSTYSCFDQDVTVGGVSYGSTDAFELRFGPVTGEPYCTIVYVRKDNNDSDSSCPVGVECTAVEARGYNTCDVDDPRRVERALRTNY